MSKHRILFQDELPSNNYSPQIEVFHNTRDTITIRLEDSLNLDDFQAIALDIPTAIKFAKTLRTEINKAKEVNNGI